MTIARNDPWSAWNLWTALIALLFFALWLIICPLHLFGGMAATSVPSIDPLASTEISSNPVALSGMGSPNSRLQLRIGDKTIGPVAVGADGRWSTSANLSGLTGTLSAVAESINADGTPGAVSSPLELILKLPTSGAATFNYPAENEQLDAQSYVLSGTAAPGESLEIWQSAPGRPAGKYASIAAGSDGTWSFVADAAKPGTKPGTYTYELRKGGATEVLASRTVVVKAGLTTASNAKCPCLLRIFTNLKQKVVGSTITLFKDGTKIGTGTGDKLFTDLAQGNYTYSVSAPNFKTYTSPAGKVSLPRNKGFEVYLEPSKP